MDVIPTDRLLETLVAIAERGDLAGAADLLDLHPSSVFRRLQRAEKQLGAPLFHRDAGGYVATALGEELLGHARRIQDEVEAAERVIRAAEHTPRGEVRITTVPSLVPVVAHALAALRERFVELTLRLDASPDTRAVERGEADLAIRPSREPPGELVGRRIARVTWARYAHEDAEDAPETAYDRPTLPGGRLPDTPGLFVATVPSMFALIRAGRATGALPCYLGDFESCLVRTSAPTDHGESLWVLTHPGLRRSPRVVAVREQLIPPLAARFGVIR